MSRHLTDLKAARQALRKQHELTRAMLEKIDQPFPIDA